MVQPQSVAYDRVASRLQYADDATLPAGRIPWWVSAPWRIFDVAVFSKSAQVPPSAPSFTGSVPSVLLRIHPKGLHVVLPSMRHDVVNGAPTPDGVRVMQRAGCGFRGTPLPRTPVNRDERKGRSVVPRPERDGLLATVWVAHREALVVARGVPVRRS